MLRHSFFLSWRRLIRSLRLCAFAIVGAAAPSAIPLIARMGPSFWIHFLMISLLCGFRNQNEASGGYVPSKCQRTYGQVVAQSGGGTGSNELSVRSAISLTEVPSCASN